jgi:ribosomal protein S18 acetylase RimI-like enzyme
MSAAGVRRIGAGEGAALREVRLRALADAPLAFGSTHGREAAYPDAHWAGWAAESGGDAAGQALFVVDPGEAGNPGEPGAPGDPDLPPSDAGKHGAATARGDERASALLGLAFVVFDRDDAARADLYSMWVAPEARRTGAGTALVTAAVDWARAHGVRRLRTAVTVGNDAAARLYTRAGFADTGTREPLGHSGAEVRVLELAL